MEREQTTLELRRFAKKDKYTIGRLYLDGRYFCDTLEDTDRGLSDDMSVGEILEAKVKGATAIPTGEYRVTLQVASPRFRSRAQYGFCKGKLPRLVKVKGFDGVLIHAGNTAGDTEGCILVGQNKKVGMVLNSLATLKNLYNRLRNKNDNIKLIIK